MVFYLLARSLVREDFSSFTIEQKKLHHDGKGGGGGGSN